MAHDSLKSQLDEFVALSIVLTGYSNVGVPIAETYMNRVLAHQFDDRLPTLLEAVAKARSTHGDLASAVRDQFQPDPTFGAPIRLIIVLWFTSAIRTEKGWVYGSPEEYFSALVWNTVGAHVPGLSGGYFDYWQYPPEN